MRLASDNARILRIMPVERAAASVTPTPSTSAT